MGEAASFHRKEFSTENSGDTEKENRTGFTLFHKNH
jgi:hypothetical protein